MSRWVLVATLVVGAASAAVAKKPRDRGLGQPQGGLAVGARVAAAQFAAGDPIALEITLANVGKQPLRVASHVATHEVHLDWYEVVLTYPVPSDEGCAGVWAGRAERRLALDDDRDKSAPVEVTLKRGARLTHTVDLQDWAARARNGGQRIPPGFYKVEVVYHVADGNGRWHGTIRSGRIPLTIEGKVPSDRCAANPGWEHF